MSTDPRYPIGKYSRPDAITSQQRKLFLDQIEELPRKLNDAVSGLTEAQIDTPYRDGGWTVKQVVHHLADSHMHGYIRAKFAKTMDNPTIMPYDEKSWSELDDAANLPIEISLGIINNVHARWTHFLRSLPQDEFALKLMHPENGPMTLDHVLALYSWHGRHHTAHVTELRNAKGW